MPLSDLPLNVLVRLFLIIFVLIGIYPAVKRGLQRLRQRVRAARKANRPFAPSTDQARARLFAEEKQEAELTSHERIVLLRLARSERRSLSVGQLRRVLLMDAKVLHETLRSLQRRGLIVVGSGMIIPGRRFRLSERGRQFAREQGYLVEVHRAA